MEMFGCILALVVFVSCFSRGQSVISKLDGSLTRTPDFIEDGKEVRLSCKFYLVDETQKINVVTTVTPGESSPNAGMTIETYKIISSKYQDEDGRWVAFKDFSFTARIEDDPVKVECFYKAGPGRNVRSADEAVVRSDIAMTILPMFIEIFADPEIEELQNCDDQPLEACVLHCKIVHKNSIKLSPGSCQWRYRPSADAPTIVVASGSQICTHVDGTRDEMSLDLTKRGAFAGQYVCHADFDFVGSKILKTYTVNGVLEVDRSSRGSDMNGPCSFQRHCKTYRATCIKANGAAEGTCRCAGRYPNIYNRTVDDHDHVLSCYGEEGPPVDACTEPTEGLWNNSLVMLVTLLAILATMLYMVCFRGHRERQN